MIETDSKPARDADLIEGILLGFPPEHLQENALYSALNFLIYFNFIKEFTPALADVSLEEIVLLAGARRRQAEDRRQFSQGQNDLGYRIKLHQTVVKALDISVNP